MKKLSIIGGIVAASMMSLSVIGCSGDKLKIVEVDPFSLTSNHRNLRIKGMGYAGEQYTELEKWEKDPKTKEDVRKTAYAIRDVKALVVPVDFTDYPATLFGNTENDSRQMLQKVFFGGPNDMEWYSLAEYYKSSSYDQCHISGVIAPWFHTGVASSSISTTNTGYSKEVAVKIQDYYREHKIVDDLNDSKEYNLADFDANQDGFIDSIIMLYTAPITTTGEVWWAFCWSVTGAYGKYTKDGSMEGANRFFWASFNFLFEKGNGQYHTAEEIKSGAAKPDAHTMTHEYGHVLSLPDYYITDYNKSDYSGLGALDMMDYNIGDHNAFSKTMYGWINPRRVDGKSGKVTTTLKSTTTTGDAIIIPAPGEWNNTYLDQYLLIEYLTPEGVAVKDGQNRYLGTYPLYYSKAGIRITQVDARLGVFANDGQFNGYTYSTSANASGTYVDFAADNTATRSAYSNYKLIELLPRTGKSMKYRTGSAGDDCLYIEGDTFGKGGVFEDFMLNGISGEKDKKFGFKIHVDKLNGNESATITISR